jgi:hypothetical protein
MSTGYALPSALTAVGTITLTSFNILSAGVVCCLIFLDNRHTGKKVWQIKPERRMPLYLATTVLISNIIFCVREVIEIPQDSGVQVNVSPGSECVALNQASWWGIPLPDNSNLGIWIPLVTATVRISSTAGSVFFRVPPCEMYLTLVQCMVDASGNCGSRCFHCAVSSSMDPVEPLGVSAVQLVCHALLPHTRK